jgi:putative tryptophan/tyrosine transport system substrate-binding protein
MNRRKLIAAFGGAVVVRPVIGGAQQPAMPVIGWLGVTSPEAVASVLAMFRGGLREAGYIEGQNVAIEYRWSEGHDERLPELAAELVAAKVDVIVTGGMPGTRAAMKATATIPIVTIVGVDPVATGLVKDLARPDGNVTGFTTFGPRTGVKRFEILSQLLPEARVVATLINLSNPVTAKSIEQYGGGLVEAMHGKGVELQRVSAGNPEEIDAAFAHLAELKADGLMLGVDLVFDTHKEQIVRLAARYRVPAIYYTRRYAEAGGLISYGVKEGDNARQYGVYAGRILAGAKPADLPFQMPTRYELVINRKTADALGLAMPLELETQADEIIE